MAQNMEAKLNVFTTNRSYALYRLQGEIRFGTDLVINLKNGSAFFNVGNVYKGNRSLCEFQDSVVDLSDMEVLYPFDSLCDPPCLRGQYCDEISGKCVCDVTKRDVQRCYERADLQAKLGEFCETAHPGENTYARFDYDVTNTNKKWRCYTRESLTGDRARFNGSPSRFYTHHSGLTAIVEDYPSLKLEALLLTAKHHFPFDDPKDVHTAKDNSLKWSGVFPRRTAGPKDYAVSTNGELRTIFLFNDTGCISDPELCVQGLTVSFWLKHSNKEAGQTFLFTGATEKADSRGLRVFQYNSSLDHVAVELRQKTQTCLWIYSAPENIWSHFVLSFDASITIGTCSSLSFFFNGERQELLYYDVESLVHAFVSPTAQVGDSSNGLPIASFDDLVIWYETFGDAVITQVYDCYKATFSTVKIKVEREIFTNQAASTFVDFERMESVTSSLISEIATLVGENNVSSVAVNKYEFANIGTKTHSGYLTVVFDQRSGDALDPLRAGTILPTNSWTVVDIQSEEGTLCNSMSTCNDIFCIAGITEILNAQVFK
ncbi:uncharacterized protein [Porites lutea]|uniref:uncharacterized protein n=1 Tax=Porites lutea TaxID=51062 RepID=UPI003CC663BF